VGACLTPKNGFVGASEASITPTNNFQIYSEKLFNSLKIAKHFIKI